MPAVVRKLSSNLPMAPRKRTRSQGPVQETREPINVARLRDLASRVAAGRVCWPGSSVDLRTVLMSFLARADDGFLTPRWNECDSPFPTRRFSQGTLFNLPRVLRSAGRCELPNTLDVDLENCHLRAQVARHPTRPELAHYVNHREQVLGEVMREGVDRQAAKALFLRLVYAGSAETWQLEHRVNALPAFVDAFAREQKEIRQEDAEKHPELLKMFTSSDRPVVTLQSHLNMRREREMLDAMAAAVRGIAEVSAYEHDGLFLCTRSFDTDGEAASAWREKVLRRIRASISEPVAVKSPLAFEEALHELRARWPLEDWDTTEEVNDEQARLAAAMGDTPEHLPCAQLVALERSAYPGSPHGVQELFKHISGGQYHHWDMVSKRWFLDDGRDRLLHVISQVLVRRLAPIVWETGDDGKSFVVRGKLPPGLSTTGFVESVEKFLRPLLRDRDFRLDDQRHLLVFENGVYDRAADSWLQLTPQIRSSRSTNWAWGASDGEQEAALRAALDMVAQDEAAFTTEACAALERLEAFLPSLAFLRSICGAWESVLYLCKHLARAVFALPYQENLWTRGPGSNGKDTLANLMQCLLGSYFANLPCEALTNGHDMDAPSQTLLNLKGRRFVAVREIARNAKIRSHIYKTISDPKGVIKARGLYGKDEEFAPHFLLYLASNVPVDIDDSSGGSARRTRILDLPFNFVEDPQSANERPRDAGIEAHFPAWRAGFFDLLLAVYKRFLRERPQSNITPVPQAVADAVDEELEEDWMRDLARFVQDRLRPAKNGQHASSAADIREAFLAQAGVPKKEVGLRLARKGFAEEGVNYYDGARRTKRRVYKLKFADGTVAFARLQDGSTGGS